MNKVIAENAGRDAIYLAAWDGRKGRWRISWDTLQQAQWKDVENAEIDGVKAEAGTEVGPNQPRKGSR
jgi:hypothetical protein